MKISKRKEKRCIITSLITGYIGLAYKGVSSYPHNKRQKALHKAVVKMENKMTLQCNKIIHLEDSMVIYGIYNSEPLEKLINTVHKMYNFTTSNQKLFAGTLSAWYMWYLTKDGINHYAIYPLFYLRMLREKIY